MPHPHSSSPPSGSRLQWLSEYPGSPPIPSTPPVLAPRPTSNTNGSSTWQASSWPTTPRPCPCWPSTPLQTGPPQGKTPPRWGPHQLWPQLPLRASPPNAECALGAGSPTPGNVPSIEGCTGHLPKGHGLLRKDSMPCPPAPVGSRCLQLSTRPSVGLDATESPFPEPWLPQIICSGAWLMGLLIGPSGAALPWQRAPRWTHSPSVQTQSLNPRLP